MAEGNSSGRCACCSFACGVLHIACFQCFRWVWPCCFQRPPPDKLELSVLCLGLDGSGKSTLLALLAGETVHNIEPTMGFSIKAFITPAASFNVRELGGGDAIRPYWSKYYEGHDAIIYVVDSACTDETLAETSTWLRSCLTDRAVRGLPLLLLCNKQDKAGARTPEKLSEELQVQQLCVGRQFMVKGSSTSGVQGTCSEVAGVQGALESLVDMVKACRLQGQVQVGWVQ